ncbi:hypothetical protein HYT84_01545 [Candidatus Micrarchaeota archaeon]|nr:hypothetical protein [Candidatus Micrarchaeota archaeon]
MTMDKLVSSLLTDAKKEADEIIKTAEWHVDKMVAEEKAKRVVLLKTSEEEADKLIKEQEKERLAWAKLESKRIISEAKEDVIKTIMQEIFSKLENFRKSKEYAAFLKSGVNNACKELGTEQSCTVHVKKGDKKYLSTKARVVEDLEGIGGALVENTDGLIRINLTLENLFESNTDLIRKEIYHKLFEA